MDNYKENRLVGMRIGRAEREREAERSWNGGTGRKDEKKTQIHHSYSLSLSLPLSRYRTLEEYTNILKAGERTED